MIVDANSKKVNPLSVEWDKRNKSADLNTIGNGSQGTVN